MECVGDMEIGWGSVMVHKAVILALFPNLARLTQMEDGRLDDTKIIFTEYPLDVIKSFVQLIYTGSCFLSPVANMKSILELIGSLGIFIQSDRFEVVNTITPEGIAKKNLSGTRTPTLSKLIKKGTSTVGHPVMDIEIKIENKQEKLLMVDAIEHVADTSDIEFGLTVHKLNHEDQSRFKSEETDCDDLIRRNKSLIQRLEIHNLKNKNGLGFHTCDQCGKQCTTKSGLKDHMLKHVKEKNFVCMECG